MIYPEELVTLFKKHGYWRVSLFLFVVACISLVLAIVFTNLAALVNAMWCAAVVFANQVICMEKESHEATKEKLADVRDQLCLSRHDVERLALELDTAHTALEASFGTASTTEGANRCVRPNTPTNTQRPKSRKPAPKRKPKTNETKNENKD